MISLIKTFGPDQRFCVIDYETYSEANLKLVGSWEYSLHHSTEILCVSWMEGTAEELRQKLKKGTKAETWFPKRPWNKDKWKPGQGKKFVNILKNPKIIKVAHNAMFEQAITRNVLPKHLGKFL